MPDSINQVSLFAAFTAGFLSFVSPCVLPLVPSYVSYITGLSVEELAQVETRQRFRRTIIVNSLLFIAGYLWVNWQVTEHLAALPTPSAPSRLTAIVAIAIPRMPAPPHRPGRATGRVGS